MTLSQYEANVLTLPGWARGHAGGPAFALRQRSDFTTDFVGARDAIASQKQHRDRLAAVDQLAVFAALTGP